MSLDHLNLTQKSYYEDMNAKKKFETLPISFPFLLYFGEFRMSRWRRQQERQTNKQTNKAVVLD